VNAFTDITAAIPAATYAALAAEVTPALDAHAERRDLCIAATGGSPRRYRIVGRDTLAATCPATASFYRSARLLELLSAVAGEPLVPVPYAPEELIATRLENAGDTHGWHWDDYGFALVWVLRAPPPEDGAALEYVTGVPWSKTDPRIDAILAQREPVRVHIATGTVYLLRSDTTLHRVTPLHRNAKRDALCFSYAALRELARDPSHETLEAILA
jgi:hypothetical protein